MPEQASAAFEKLQALTNDEATLITLRAEIETASQHTAAVDEVSTVDAVSEFNVDESAAEITVDEIPAAAPEAPVVVEEISPEPPAPVAQVEAPPAPHAEPAAAEPPVIRALCRAGAWRSPGVRFRSRVFPGREFPSSDGLARSRTIIRTRFSGLRHSGAPCPA